MQETLSSSRVVVHNAFFNLAGYAVSALYMFFLIPVIVGYLGVEQFGLWSLILALTGYIGLADLGLNTSFVKYIAEYVSQGDHRRVNQVVQHGLLFYAALTVVFVCVGYFLFPLAFDVLRIPAGEYDNAHRSFMIALVGFGIANIATVFSSVLSGIQRTDMFNILVAILLPVKFLASYVALDLGYGLTGLMIADAIVSAGSIIPLAWVAKTCYPPLTLRHVEYDALMMKRLLRFGSQLQVSRLAELIQFQFDKILLSRFIGLQAVSVYDVGSRPLTRLRALPTAAIASLVPAVSALDAVNDRSRIQAALIRSTRYLIILAMPAFAYVICFAHELVAAWLGPGFGTAATTMQILAFGYAISVGAMALSLVSQGMGEPKHQMHATIIQSVVNIVLSSSLLFVFGYFGAVAGTTISIITGATLFYYLYGRRMMDRPILTMARLWAKPIANVMPSVLFGFISGLLWAGRSGTATRIEILLFLIAVAVVFFCAYGFMTYVTNTLSVDDRDFVARVIPGRLKYLLKFF
jgi:O-antigen/teichoic acid export membrane protein